MYLGVQNYVYTFTRCVSSFFVFPHLSTRHHTKVLNRTHNCILLILGVISAPQCLLSVNCCYKSVYMPAGSKRIFTENAFYFRKHPIKFSFEKSKVRYSSHNINFLIKNSKTKCTLSQIWFRPIKQMNEIHSRSSLTNFKYLKLYKNVFQVSLWNYLDLISI